MRGVPHPLARVLGINRRVVNTSLPQAGDAVDASIAQNDFFTDIGMPVE